MRRVSSGVVLKPFRKTSNINIQEQIERHFPDPERQEKFRPYQEKLLETWLLLGEIKTLRDKIDKLALKYEQECTIIANLTNSDPIEVITFISRLS